MEPWLETAQVRDPLMAFSLEFLRLVGLKFKRICGRVLGFAKRGV